METGSSQVPMRGPFIFRRTTNSCDIDKENSFSFDVSSRDLPQEPGQPKKELRKLPFNENPSSLKTRDTNNMSEVKGIFGLVHLILKLNKYIIINTLFLPFYCKTI